jgi:uncharacterized membrane protein YjjP (DUF1212 family)
MSDSRLQTNLLLQAGRLLLEDNEATAEIHRALASTARALTDDPCHVVVSYGGVAVSLAGESPALESIHELRYNTAVQARVHGILADVRRGTLEAEPALVALSRIEAETPRHPRWLAGLVLGAAAASLAGLLGADLAAAAVAGLATALGLLVRQELGRRHFSLLTLPLTATFIGAVLGGLAIELGLTHTPELALVVPALMVVPGPHLINGLLDLIDNHVPMSLARLGLAIGILFASTLGIVLGIELTLRDPVFADQAASTLQLNLFSDVVLAGIVTCGFAMFYNTPWSQIWTAVLGGMAGHGLRFLALEVGCQLEVATFLGGLTVGLVSTWIARFYRVPVAVLAFAGAVTMIPGLQLYRALGGALQLARLGETSDAGAVTRTISDGLQGGLVVCGLALGLILGTRVVLALADEPDASGRSRKDQPIAGSLDRHLEHKDDQ